MATEQPAQPRRPQPTGTAAWLPASWEKHHAYALQALSRGEATADQQRIALDWVITHAAATYDQTYRPGGLDGDRDTAFACGRSFVGQQIVKLLKMNLGKIPNREPNADQHEPR